MRAGATPAILSGPSFAADVARGLPTAVTLARRDEASRPRWRRRWRSRTFRPYQSTDVRGVEIGGAAKNVLAIAAGIVTGRGLGASASAALTTRGFAELVRFGRALGARTETMMGLSGPGRSGPDLLEPAVAQFFASASALGKGAGGEDTTPRPARRGRLHRAGAAGDGEARKSVDMPISAAVAAVLAGEMSVDQAIESLLDAAARAED